MIAFCFWLAAAAAGTPTVPEETRLVEGSPGLDPAEIVGAPEGAPIEGPLLDSRSEATASKLRCPTCQGMSVAESPAEGARAMKLEVRKMVAAGYSETQVLDFFEAAYGEFILLEPHRRGLNLVLWIAPAAILVAGLALTFARTRGRPPGPPAALPPPPSDPYLQRVEREIDS